MKKMYIENCNIDDLNPKAEAVYKFSCDPTSWEAIATAINEGMALEGEEAYTVDTIQEEYPHYLTICKDGVILLFL